ncbi:MAG: geranylgeranylglyceryl/heptaprenylglyceryl phosphate synthase [Caldithrix sp.]|nr:geranylgeranylglyceryl/heptaprenylglyceryl phosphate synthase [Caldithrix sp.]
MPVYHDLLSVMDNQAAGYFILIDPDKTREENLPHHIETAIEAGVDAFLVGGSLLMHGHFDDYVKAIKKYSANLPVVLFPGGVHQISPAADALLFISIISGRNVEYIIGSQVVAAPIIHKLNIEPISTAYMLVESGRPTSAEFMSGTRPLPAHKPDIAVAHALAAQYLGFQTIYLEGGSGADHSVPEEMIYAVSQSTNIPIIVGGGIRTPDQAHKKVSAGASFIVTGNVLEKNNDPHLIKDFVAAIHQQ